MNLQQIIDRHEQSMRVDLRHLSENLWERAATMNDAAGHDVCPTAIMFGWGNYVKNDPYSSKDFRVIIGWNLEAGEPILRVPYEGFNAKGIKLDALVAVMEKVEELVIEAETKFFQK